MLVFPFWSTQMWFTMLISMLVSNIIVLPTEPPIFLPWRPEFRYPLACKVRLSTAIVSSRISEQVRFHQSLLNMSLTINQENTKQISDQNCLSGTNFVWHRKLIPIDHLQRSLVNMPHSSQTNSAPANQLRNISQE